MATERTCRICFDVIESEGVMPCECRDGGEFTIAHEACIQQWINLRPMPSAVATDQKDPSRCEVCGTAWKQDYQMPEAPVELSRAEWDDRAQALLLAAFARHTRLGGLQPRDGDAAILHVLGPLYDGPWQRRPTLTATLSKGTRRLLAKLRGATGGRNSSSVEQLRGALRHY
uniref:RING-CH-type domain-containing protein n=1 Tax=Haptolina brevifila TaxID=156173 RepID=A0A7S2N8E6_9EUKA|mmetsp:Transcript_69973/g.138721  ORF Transcript_69973/g.138721 Transcript_69973/m.138721 type:complete len:172 (+) Transcript_69973:143-658(+)|eukprot:CAMPEP_0174716700 /NCGR_PEP_ID=MMETSP1094-20130205/24403_1 /TAXON_ID=156173 /ORGANISM="Chrysochromulina brevifilum, Strain UTEX LB 985" /LENGTH=171 /DNA_ID=CAMNT_0015916493 /DNA_START=140 /DNA_END=655 /DNA_ORIENTATION=+